MIKKTTVKSCSSCKKEQVLLQFDFPLDETINQQFLDVSFTESKSYATKGILYAEDKNIVVMGQYGSNRLTISCKTKTCSESIEKVENILKSIKV